MLLKIHLRQPISFFEFFMSWILGFMALCNEANRTCQSVAGDIVLWYIRDVCDVLVTKWGLSDGDSAPSFFLCKSVWLCCLPVTRYRSQGTFAIWGHLRVLYSLNRFYIWTSSVTLMQDFTHDWISRCSTQNRITIIITLRDLPKLNVNDTTGHFRLTKYKILTSSQYVVSTALLPETEKEKK